MEVFYLIVLSVAVLFLILLLTSFGVMLKKAKAVKAYPQNAPYCPDYWDVVPTVNADGTMDYKCKVPSSFTAAQIEQLKKYGKGTTINVPSTSVIPDTATGTTYMNFYADETWKGNTGVCNKYKWATTNRAGTINWDGITNVNNAAVC